MKPGSRGRARAIRDSLPSPTRCDVCLSAGVELTTNARIYGRDVGWPSIYLCNDCGAYVGCHPGTKIPLGRLAAAATRRLRSMAHAAFDPLWKQHGLSRSEAYKWLAARLGIPARECHLSWLTDSQLETTIAACREECTKRGL